MLDDARRVAHCGRTRRHRFDHHGVRTDARPVADRKATKDLGPGTDHDALAQGGVALGAFVESCAAERDALVNRAVVADFGCFANDYAETVINEYAPPDFGARVNLDAGQHAADMRHEAAKPQKACCPQPVGGTVDHDRVQPGVTGEHLELAAGSRISLKDAGDVFAQIVQHSVGMVAQRMGPREINRTFRVGTPGGPW